MENMDAIAKMNGKENFAQKKNVILTVIMEVVYSLFQGTCVLNGEVKSCRCHNKYTGPTCDTRTCVEFPCGLNRK